MPQYCCQCLASPLSGSALHCSVTRVHGTACRRVRRAATATARRKALGTAPPPECAYDYGCARRAGASRPPTLWGPSPTCAMRSSASRTTTRGGCRSRPSCAPPSRCRPPRQLRAPPPPLPRGRPLPCRRQSHTLTSVGRAARWRRCARPATASAKRTGQCRAAAAARPTRSPSSWRSARARRRPPAVRRARAAATEEACRRTPTATPTATAGVARLMRRRSSCC